MRVYTNIVPRILGGGGFKIDLKKILKIEKNPKYVNIIKKRITITIFDFLLIYFINLPQFIQLIIFLLYYLIYVILITFC